MDKIKRVVIHCSASDNPEQDSLEAIKHLHVAPLSEKIQWGNYETHGKNFRDIGYHYVITKDGVLHKGRPDNIQGAHVSGFNTNSLGVCMSGNKDFTVEQFKTLIGLKAYLKVKHGYDLEFIGHCDLNLEKTCPNFEVKEVLG